MTKKRETTPKKKSVCKSLVQPEPRNAKQQTYLEQIDKNIITFGVGPAGTGKTFLAIYKALHSLWTKKKTRIDKIILTRPVVDAGGKLGFLPGDLEDKMDPYMRPLYDAMHYFAGVATTLDKLQKHIIEIAPVAFMRGRTFSNCFVILDEGQNCSFDQLKMIITRLGENSKLVITGDASQSDLVKLSGLIEMIGAIESVDNVGVVRFNDQEVTRSKIVRDILLALKKGRGHHE